MDPEMDSGPKNNEMLIQGQHVAEPTVRFSTHWNLLGPFQIGTREATWGADPLERFGGFRSLAPTESTTYPSSLAKDGVVHWSATQAHLDNAHLHVASAKLVISFPNVDWTSLQSIYGWPALQYQAWARGSLAIQCAQTIVLYTDGVLEFWIDDKSYFGGDFYAYHNAPLVLYLEPGDHKLDVRLIRDVRAFGANAEPSLELELRCERSKDHLALDAERLLVADIVDGLLSSSFASVPVRNESSIWIDVHAIQSKEDDFKASMIQEAPLRVAPGQTRPLNFKLNREGNSSTLRLLVEYSMGTTTARYCSEVISYKLGHRSMYDPQKVTFVHQKNTISYAILRPPSVRVSKTCNDESLPILINLHGAGTEADSEEIRTLFDAVPDLRCWLLSPEGVTSWSGDDWHTWGFADVEAAVAVIPAWMERMNWRGPNVHVRKWLVVGHSNGGQGAWYAVTHRPDRIIGCALVSGYSSIQGYVPYDWWTEADPRVSSMLRSATASYRHELLLNNVSGIPLFKQHGSADDNVPVFHSRRMNQLIYQSDPSSRLSRYGELPDKGHWFEGIMTTTQLRIFYQEVLDHPFVKEVPPAGFVMVVANPADTGSKHGVVVDQKSQPDQLGSVNVRPVIGTGTEMSIWEIETSNILRFHINREGLGELHPACVMIDGDEVRLPAGQSRAFGFYRSEDNTWIGVHDQEWKNLTQRYGAQLGNMEAILRGTGSLTIRMSQAATFDVALQTARNLYQYFKADTEIRGPDAALSDCEGNSIRIAHGRELDPSALAGYPIQVDPGQGLCILDGSGRQHIYAFRAGLGVAMLRPLAGARLELVLWGYDLEGLRYAARLLPMQTGVGQPDFIVVNQQCAWKGASGVSAMGFFDSAWQVSGASYLT